MDSKAALDKIREAEFKAQEIIEQAKRESQEILREAKAEKERLIKHAAEQANQDCKKLKIKIEEEAAREVAALGGLAEEEIRILKEKVQARLAEATEFLKAKIEL